MSKISLLISEKKNNVMVYYVVCNILMTIVTKIRIGIIITKVIIYLYLIYLIYSLIIAISYEVYVNAKNMFITLK